MSHPTQKVFFDLQMRPVSEVVQLWLDNGWTRNEIFEELGFRLGYSNFALPSIDEFTPEALAAVCVKYMPKMAVAA